MLAFIPIFAYITSTWLSLMVTLDSRLAAVGLSGPCAYGYCENIISSYAANEPPSDNTSVLQHFGSLTADYSPTPSLTVIVSTPLPLAKETYEYNPLINQMTLTMPDRVAPATPQRVLHIPDLAPTLCSKTVGVNPPTVPRISFHTIGMDPDVTAIKVYTSPKKARLSVAMRNNIILIVNTLRSFAVWAVTISFLVIHLLCTYGLRFRALRPLNCCFQFGSPTRQFHSKPPSRLDVLISGTDVHIEELEVAAADNGEITILPANDDLNAFQPKPKPSEQHEGILESRLTQMTESQDALKLKFDTVKTSLVAAEEKNKAIVALHEEADARNEQALKAADQSMEELSNERDRFRAEANHHAALLSIAETRNASMPKTIARLRSSLTVREKDLDLAQSSNKVLTNVLEETGAKLEMSEWRYKRTETMRRDTAKAYRDVASIHMHCHGDHISAVANTGKQLTATTTELEIAREHLKKSESGCTLLDHRNTDISKKLAAAELEIAELKPRLVKTEDDLEREKAAYAASDLVIRDLEAMSAKAERDLVDRKAAEGESERIISDLKARLANAMSTKDELETEIATRRESELALASLREHLAKTAKIEEDLEKEMASRKTSELAIVDLRVDLTKIEEELENEKAVHKQSELTVSLLKATLSKTADELQKNEAAHKEHISIANARLSEYTAAKDKELRDFKAALLTDFEKLLEGYENREVGLKAELDKAQKEIADARARMELDKPEPIQEAHLDIAGHHTREVAMTNTEPFKNSIFDGKAFDTSGLHLPVLAPELTLNDTLLSFNQTQTVPRNNAGTGKNVSTQLRPGAKIFSNVPLSGADITQTASKVTSSRSEITPESFPAGRETVPIAPKEAEDTPMHDQSVAETAPHAPEVSQSAAFSQPVSKDIDMTVVKSGSSLAVPNDQNAEPSAESQSPMANFGEIYDGLNADYPYFDFDSFNADYPDFDINGFESDTVTEYDPRNALTDFDGPEWASMRRELLESKGAKTRFNDGLDSHFGDGDADLADPRAQGLNYGPSSPIDSDGEAHNSNKSNGTSNVVTLGLSDLDRELLGESDVEQQVRHLLGLAEPENYGDDKEDAFAEEMREVEKQNPELFQPLPGLFAQPDVIPEGPLSKFDPRLVGPETDVGFARDRISTLEEVKARKIIKPRGPRAKATSTASPAPRKRPTTGITDRKVEARRASAAANAAAKDAAPAEKESDVSKEV